MADPPVPDKSQASHVPLFTGTPTTISVKSYIVEIAQQAVNHVEWSDMILEITENRHGEQSGARCRDATGNKPLQLLDIPGVARKGECKDNHAAKAQKREEFIAKRSKEIMAGVTETDPKKREQAEKDAKAQARKELLVPPLQPKGYDFHSWCGDFATWVFWKAWVLKKSPETEITKKQMGEFLNREAVNGSWVPGNNLNLLEEYAKKQSGQGILTYHKGLHGLLDKTYVPQPGDIWFANRGGDGHVSIVEYFDPTPKYTTADKSQTKPYWEFVTLDGKSFDDDWNHQSKPLSAGQQGVARTWRKTNDAKQPNHRAFVDTSKLRQKLGYK